MGPADRANAAPGGTFARPPRVLGDAMPSTVIERYDYDPAAQELEVLFTTGRRYVYRGVPPEEVEAFRAAFSKGRYFNAHIRDRYAFTEVASAET